MLFSFIVKLILILSGLLLCSIAFISKLNRTSSIEDQQQYDPNFNPYKDLAFYADDKSLPEEEFDNNKVKYYQEKQTK